jgi:hypothetical protein
MSSISRTPSPSHGLDNYWSFSAAAIILLFILYIVKVGSFGKWVQILLYAAPTVASVSPSGQVTPGSPGAAAPATQPETGPSAANPNVAPGQSNTGANDKLNRMFGVPPTFDPWGWVQRQFGGGK